MNHPESHDITALAYSLVPSPEREKLLEHLSTCDECRESYDAAFEEQAQVREVMFEEARSGEAEARALDKVLQTLKNLPAPEEALGAGRLFSLRGPAVYALQIAAALLVAAGVFYVSVVMPRSGGKGEGEVAEGGVGGGSLSNPDVVPSKPEGVARVDKGSVMVVADAHSNPDTASKWIGVSEIPLGVWAKSEGETVCNLAFASLALGDKTCFKLEQDPINAGQIAIYVLNGEADVTNAKTAFSALTNTANFVATPGSTWSVECDRANTYSYYRGNELPPAENGRALGRARVKQGNVVVYPAGEMWTKPLLGAVLEGKQFEVLLIKQADSRKLDARGAVVSEDAVTQTLQYFEPESREKIRLECERYNKAVQELLTCIQLGDEYRTVEFTLASDVIVSKVTINGKTKTFEAKTFEELSKDIPEIADLIAKVEVKKVGEKRTLATKVVQRAPRAPSVPQENKQQEQEKPSR